MKKMFVLLVLTLLLVSAVPIVAQDTDAATGPGVARMRDVPGPVLDGANGANGANDDSGDGDVETSDGETRYERCVRLATDNTEIQDPEAVCERIINRGRMCVEVLEEEGVKEPMAKCTRLGLYVATQVREMNQERRESLVQLREEVKERLGQQVREVVAEYRVERVARLQEHKPDAADFIHGLSEEKQNVFMHMGRDKQKQLLEMDGEDAGEELGKFQLKKVQAANMFKNRVVQQVKIRAGEMRYEEARERYQNAKDELQDARTAFEDAKRSGDSEAAMAAAKDYLLLAADIEIAALEKILGTVEASEELTEDEAAEIIADIEGKIIELQDAKEAVEAATTKEEVQDAARLILSVGRKIKFRFERHVMRMKYREVGVVVERSAQLEERFDCAITALEEQGIDTSAIQDLMDDFSAKIESARDKHSQANDMLIEAKESDASGQDFSDKVKEARSLLQSAQDDLQDAHTLLKEILREVKAAGGDLSACSERDADLDEDEEYVIEEVDDEDYDDIEVGDDDDADDDDEEEDTPEVILCADTPSNPECTCGGGYEKVDGELTGDQTEAYWVCQEVSSDGEPLPTEEVSS